MNHPPQTALRVKCGAKLRNKPGRYCQTWAMANGRCRLHGGALPAPGASHPNYKHGRYSKALPERMRESFEASQRDPDLLSRRRDIALLDARNDELLARAGDGEPVNIWPKLKQAREAFKAASRIQEREDRQAALAEAIEQMTTLIDIGTADYEIWDEVGTNLDRRNRLAEGDRKRLESLRAYLHIDQAMAMFDALAEAVRTHVSNVDERSAIARELSKYAARFAGGEIHRTGEPARS